MQTYKQILGMDMSIQGVERLTDNAFIPLDPENTDYKKMKTDILAGAELQDPTGAVIDGVAWAGTLP